MQDSWSDYWQSEDKEGEVFVTRDGEQPAYLAQFWQKAFAALPSKARVLDIASGAGSVFSNIESERLADLQLTATDISAEALSKLKKRIKGVNTVECDSTELPIEDESFDWVVSQYGVEYAGLSAFNEAFRVLAPGGVMKLLCHYQGGYIDSKNRLLLQSAELARDSKFIDVASELVDASFAKDANRLQAARQGFTQVERPFAQSFKHLQQGIHLHLYMGFKQLFTNKAKYHQKDIIKWLDDMRADVERNVARLTTMCNAALSVEDIKQLDLSLSSMGAKEFSAVEFGIPEVDQVAAWVITVHKP